MTRETGSRGTIRAACWAIVALAVQVAASLYLVGAPKASFAAEQDAERVAPGTGAVPEPPPIRIDEVIDLELQQIYVTLTDRKGRRVTTLRSDDFAVRENGLAQEIVTFGVGEIPFTAILLVDSSLSMSGLRLEAALAAARQFCRGMRPLDQAQVLAFSDHILRATPVGSGEALLGALAGPLEASGGTAVRDHLYLASQLLENRQGRRAIILLSDGWDHLSVLASEDLREAFERGQSVLYWVRLAGDEPTSFHLRDGGHPAFREFRAVRYNPSPSSWHSEREARASYRKLQALPRMTGGRIAVAASVGEMRAAVGDILNELHEQYALGYYPDRANRLPFYPVEVKVRGRGLEVWTRPGYVDR